MCRRSLSSPVPPRESAAGRLGLSPLAAMLSSCSPAATTVCTKWHENATQPVAALWQSRQMSPTKTRCNKSWLGRLTNSGVSTRGSTQRRSGATDDSKTPHPRCSGESSTPPVRSDPFSARRSAAVPRQGHGVLVNVASLYGRLSSPLSNELRDAGRKKPVTRQGRVAGVVLGDASGGHVVGRGPNWHGGRPGLQ